MSERLTADEVNAWIARLDETKIQREPYRNLRTMLVTLLDEITVEEEMRKEAMGDVSYDIRRVILEVANGHHSIAITDAIADAIFAGKIRHVKVGI